MRAVINARKEEMAGALKPCEEESTFIGRTRETQVERGEVKAFGSVREEGWIIIVC